MKIRVLIVDDEPRAHKVMENYIHRIPEMELAGSCHNAIEAYNFLKTTPVDLILLDITMPEIDGFGFIRMLEKPPFIIFTTAHSEFALESYEFNAVDYLKKPIPFDRFLKAVNKLQLWIKKGLDLVPEKDFIELKINGTVKPIPVQQILYIQSLGNYIKVYMESSSPFVTQSTTKDIEDSLAKSSFIRIHKSSIVNKNKIERVLDEEVIVMGDIRLPIGKTFKKYVKETVLHK